MKTSTPMETKSEWEGTKEKVVSESQLTASENHKGYVVRNSKGHWIAEFSPLDPDGIKGGENVKLFTDALHTVQECGMMPSELRDAWQSERSIRIQDSAGALKEINQLKDTLNKSLYELSQKLEGVARIANHHAEENAKLKKALNAANDYIARQVDQY